MTPIRIYRMYVWKNPRIFEVFALSAQIAMPMSTIVTPSPHQNTGLGGWRASQMPKRTSSTSKASPVRMPYLNVYILSQKLGVVATSSRISFW